MRLVLSRFLAVLGLSSICLCSALASAWAQDVRVVESAPEASAVIQGRSSEFFVRFDRPVDHVHSSLAILQNGNVVERLQPRLEAAPEVLFARAPTLPPGNYSLHWAVRTMTGTEVIRGDIPFSVNGQR